MHTLTDAQAHVRPGIFCDGMPQAQSRLMKLWIHVRVEMELIWSCCGCAMPHLLWNAWAGSGAWLVTFVGHRLLYIVALDLRQFYLWLESAMPLILFIYVVTLTHLNTSIWSLHPLHKSSCARCHTNEL